MVKVVIGTRKISAFPEFAGNTWAHMQYLLGLLKLGVDCYWVDHLGAIDPINHHHSLDYLMEKFERTARDFGFADRYCVVYNGGERYFGMTENQLSKLVGETGLLINISKHLNASSHLMCIPTKVYIDIDPGFTQIWASQWDLSRYAFFFTVGQNVGRARFRIPTKEISWQPIFPPVVLDLWPAHIDEKCTRFSTIADWRGKQHAIFRGQYFAGKRQQYMKFLSVPLDANQEVDLALCIGYDDYEDMGLLHAHNWHVLDPYLYAGDPQSYREFIQFSRAEFGVAKGGYVKSRSGWISERTACYLASGKPALVQSTGFEWSLPVGKGLLTFRTREEALAGIESINNDYLSHCQAARRIAEDYFDSDKVLATVLERVGLE